MLEFNPDGTIKLPENQIRQQQLDRQSIVITREQISVKPARAQIRIKLPETMENESLINFYSKIDDSEFKSVEHSIQKIDEHTFVIKVDKGAMLMYGLLNFLIDCFKSKLSNSGCNKVIVRGMWAKYGNGSVF
jgi:hypothetical protein